jgi:hypothetical protein
MRKIFLAIITVSIFVCSANAQIKKGSIFLGGNISGSTQKTKTTDDVTTFKQNVINILPVFGRAIKENLVLGVNVGFGIYDSEYPAGNNINFKASSYSAGVFLRKYKNIGTSGFYLFIQGGLEGGYMTQKQEYPYAPGFDESKRISIGINVYPGLSYAVSKKLHLETGFNNLLSLNYFNEKRENGSPVTTSKTNGFNIASSLNNATSSLFLGFRLLIGK